MGLNVKPSDVIRWHIGEESLLDLFKPPTTPYMSVKTILKCINSITRYHIVRQVIPILNNSVSKREFTNISLKAIFIEFKAMPSKTTRRKFKQCVNWNVIKTLNYFKNLYHITSQASIL